MRKVLVLVSLLLVLSLGCLAVGGVSYQGILQENGKLVNGTKSFSFKLYDDLNMGSLLATYGPVNLTVVEGVYSYELPKTVFATNGNTFLEVVVDNNSLLPRTKINSAPYAVRADSLASGAILPTLNISGAGAQPNDALVIENGQVAWKRIGVIPQVNPFVGSLLAANPVVKVYPEVVAPSIWKHVFVTSASYNGNLGGVIGANQKCNADLKRINGKTYDAVIYGGRWPNLGGSRSSNFVSPNQTGYYTHDKFNHLEAYSLMGADLDIGSDTHSVYTKAGETEGGYSQITFLSSSHIFIGDAVGNCNQWQTSLPTSFFTASTSTFLFSDGRLGQGKVPGTSCSNSAKIVCVEQ